MTPPPGADRADLLTWIADGSAQRWRKQAGHTLESAASVVGVAASTLYRWESGRHAPTSRPSVQSYLRALRLWRSVPKRGGDTEQAEETETPEL